MTKKENSADEEGGAVATFWEHLDALRASLIRVVVAAVLAAVVAFCFKDELFCLVLAPHSSDFFLYRLLGGEPFCVPLINVGLTEQFMAHIRVAFYVGVLFISPYILYTLFAFISPALYAKERRYGLAIVVSAYLMFMLGTVLNYLIIFPFTVKFLGTYSVSGEVANMLTLSSYIDMLLVMSMMLGVVFELPVVAWLLGRMGILSSQLMARYRRHAIVAILVVAAVITPTTDVFTLLVVSLPIWLLYEVSIFINRISPGQP